MPELTGQKELDKKLISKYKGEITRKKNDILELFEQGVISSEEAEKQLSKLTNISTKISLSSGKGKKAKKVTFKKLVSAKLPVLNYPKGK